MMYFVDGLTPAIRALFLSFREEQHRSEMLFHLLVPFYRFEGEAYRIQTGVKAVKNPTVKFLLRATAS